MRDVVLSGVAYTLLLACTFDATGETAGGAGDESGTESGTAATSVDPTAPTGTPTSDPSDPSTSTGSTSGPPTGDTSTDPSQSGPTDDASETGDPPTTGCPQPLPDDWVLCEDFEGIEDPAMHFARWYIDPAAAEHFMIDTTHGLSGEASLVAVHGMGWAWSGAAWIRFGAGPGGTRHAPNDTFDEVWVRLQLFLEDGWDVGGMGDVIEVNSVTDGFTHVMSASIDAPAPGQTLRARARTCVIGDGTTLNCDGNNDFETMVELGSAPGTTSLFDGSGAGAWHCLVLHVRLNEPGVSDGLVEMSLDDELEADVDALDLRGMRDDGINVIHLSAFRGGGGGGGPWEFRRYIDDIVVSTSALDCE